MGKKKVPEFKSLEAERRFWQTHSFTEFLDETEEVSDVEFVFEDTRRQPQEEKEQLSAGKK
jgi:hypothetical protein